MPKPVVNIWGTQAPSSEEPRENPWNTEWTLDGGTAWVYYSSPNQKHVRRPVILADGFSMGESRPFELWEGLENGAFPFVSKLREHGFDLVVLGYKERSASILTNANVAIDCLKKTIADREGAAKLIVGGFSMGGLVTRYALAKMERDGLDHQTSTYLSYDSPHTGAWMPLGLQAFAHFASQHWGDHPDVGQMARLLSAMVNSPAARELMRWHLVTPNGPIQKPAQERIDFLAELNRVGSWPRDVLLLGVGNGVATGVGNGVDAGVTAMGGSGPQLGGTLLNTQDMGEQTVAYLQKAGENPVEVTTSGLPRIDGAPGGLFPEVEVPQLPFNPASFGQAAVLASGIDGVPARLIHNTTTFVPTVSAVAAGEIDDNDRLYSKITEVDSELHRFECADTNEGHTVMTAKLGQWILDQLLIEF